MSESWIPTVCYMCFNCCGIEVRHENAVVVEIRGDPDNPHNRGKLCAKGEAAIMSLYNPGRLTVDMLLMTSSSLSCLANISKAARGFIVSSLTKRFALEADSA